MSISETVAAMELAGVSPRRRTAPPLPSLPAIAPGQLWLVEAPAAGPLPPEARYVLDGANVVIYDRLLVDAVADALPLGSYAEPVLSREEAAARGVRFARDGWSVARLFAARLPHRERARCVQDVVDELAAAKIPGRLPVAIAAEAADGIEEHIAARFDELSALVASYPRDTRLTIVIDAFPDGAAMRLHAVAANGLAG